jgi:predicted GNAT family acetyltransferase
MNEQQSTPGGAAPDAEDVEVGDHPAAERYEVRVGGALAGFAQYQRGPGQIAFTHTEVDDAFGGRGLAGRLARKSLDDARASGSTVLPFCPFYQSWIKKHPEYAELIPEARRAEFDL